MEALLFVLKLFPCRLKDKLTAVIDENELNPEEIRVRLGQDIVIKAASNEYFCEGTAITEYDMSYIIMNATNGAFHSLIHDLQNGFLPLEKGCRLGICGEGIMLENHIHNIQRISSICIRIPHEVKGCSDHFYDEIIAPNFQNTIIVGPPGSGKTTLLREIIRKLSDDGCYVGIADERGEISGIKHGVPTFDIGIRTDIISGIPKSTAASMILRTMAPDIIAMDEITSVKDMPAITEAVGCGVGLLTTMHGRGLYDLEKPSFRPIYELRAFEYAIFIEVENKKRNYILSKLND